MRIAFWHDLPSGGAYRAMCNQLRELSARGHELAVWTPQTHKEHFASGWFPAEVPEHALRIAPEPKASFLDERFQVPLDLKRRQASAFHEHARAVGAAITEWRADVLFVHPSWFFLASPLALYWDGPSVLYLQEPNRDLYEATPTSVWALPRFDEMSFRSRIGRWVRDRRSLAMRRRMVSDEAEWVGAYDRVLVNSLFSRESVSRAYGIDSQVCQLGADHEPFLSAVPVAKTRTVVCLGSLNYNKGAHLAIAAIGSIPADQRPALSWFGNFSHWNYRMEMIALAEKLGVDFRFVAEADDSEVVANVSRAACFLYCSRLEPLGLAPLEANLCGTSVVAVAEGGVRETIVEGVNGSLALNADPRRLGALVLRYLDDLPFAEASGRAAREHVLANHSWKAAGDALEAHLEDTLANHREAERAPSR